MKVKVAGGWKEPPESMPLRKWLPGGSSRGTIISDELPEALSIWEGKGQRAKVSHGALATDQRLRPPGSEPPSPRAPDLVS